MPFTAWTLLIDIGCLCGLLLIGILLRATVGWVQRLLLPASIIAGVLGLALGENGVGLLPFSDQLGTYATILTAAVFGALPLTGTFTTRGRIRQARVMWSYSVSTYLMQWGLGLLFAIAVLGIFFDLPDGFGLLLAAGWAGGFGTASAVGGTLADGGWQQATSLAFTSATVGVVVCIVGGLILVKWGTKLAGGDATELPTSIRTGLLSTDEREPIGRATVSPISLESLALHVSVITVSVLAGYLLTEGAATLFPEVAIPVFAVAFLCGLVLRTIIDRTPARHYLDDGTMKSISGSATDFLVVTGIVSIVPSVVADYLVPLVLLMVFGLGYCLLVFRFLTPRMFGERWLERGLFTWGWSTASIATGLALLRIVDPKLKSGTIEEFGLAYIGFGPVEIAMAIIAPMAIIAGFSGSFIATTVIFGIGLLLVTFLRRWPSAHNAQQSGSEPAHTVE